MLKIILNGKIPYNVLSLGLAGFGFCFKSDACVHVYARIATRRNAPSYSLDFPAKSKNTTSQAVFWVQFDAIWVHSSRHGSGSLLK